MTDPKVTAQHRACGDEIMSGYVFSAPMGNRDAIKRYIYRIIARFFPAREPGNLSCPICQTIQDVATAEIWTKEGTLIHCQNCDIIIRIHAETF